MKVGSRFGSRIFLGSGWAVAITVGRTLQPVGKGDFVKMNNASTRTSPDDGDECPCHGAHEHFCSDGKHLNAFPKLRTTPWEKQRAVVSVLQKLDIYYPGAGTGAAWKFYEKMEQYDNSTLYGFKFSRVNIEYHQVRSLTSTHIRFRCEACEMATDPIHFLHSEPNAIHFLDMFRKLVAPVMIEDKIDVKAFQRSQSKEVPPPPPPKPPVYDCQYEWERQTNDAVKKWAFAQPPPPPPRDSRSGSSSSRNSEASELDSPEDDADDKMECAFFLLEKEGKRKRRKRALEIVTDLMKRSGGSRQKAADILVDILWPARDTDVFALMDDEETTASPSEPAVPSEANVTTAGSYS